MKYFALLLMSALLVGCMGSVEKGEEAPEETNTEVEETELEGRNDSDDEDEMDEEGAEEEAAVEEEEEEVAQVEEDDEDEDEEDSDDTETYVYESGTVTWSGAKVVGGGYSGTVDVTAAEAVMDDESLVSAMFELDMTSINSGVGGLDDHLKNEDFFDVEKYPTATLKLTGAAPDEAADTYMLSGTLEIMDQTHPIEFLATVKEVNEQISAQAEFEIDRTKWGITYGSGNFFKDIGDRAIKDEIGFVVDVTLSEQE